ncbi:S-adenosyl-L-methionine-dependent methyltransferase [Catenaria anguillulae PL171]|uniref:peptide chain release factor N(5)-glutamine methyltransferase n=1 Tax=Catenaria anguillulae PL171 TaxID=765915 RepID=A0A1Y2H773_9FUNG|nr:S-adenosyl-L-methionine-dependent methyltransferase [Catenaria anguillulae PL171]
MTLAALLSRLQSHPTIGTRAQALFELRFLAQHAFPSRLPRTPPTTLAALSQSLPADLSPLAILVEQRTTQNKPLQYILGTVPFANGLELLVRPPVLIPRPETEWWVEEVAQRIRSHGPRTIKVVDMCSGSGCAGLGLLSFLPEPSHDVRVVGVDIDPQALELSRANAAKCRFAERAKYIHHDLMTASQLPAELQQADLVLANPPYIAQGELSALDADVREWESHVALVGGEDGSEFYPVLSRLAWRMLTARHPHQLGEQEGDERKVPIVAMEIGHDQGSKVREMMCEWFEGVEVWKDRSGRDRCVVAMETRRRKDG